MRVANLILVAFRSLARNKMRTFLTMLGIIIGVGSVIAMLAIGEGSRVNIQNSIASLGTNSIMIFPGAITHGGVRMEAGSVQSLTKEDAQAIAQQCDLINYVSPVVTKGAQVIASNQNWRTLCIGIYNDYFNIRGLNLSNGRLFSASEHRSAAKVCIIGLTVSNNLFGEGHDPVGEYMRINTIPFRIIGLMEKKGQNTFGQDQDDVIIAPFLTVQKRMLSTTNVNQILASSRTAGAMDDATDEIIQLIRSRHHLKDTDEDDFTVRTQADISNIFGSVSKVLTILLASIASIALLVGGIGIMNIMLVSVTERTREIGIRMAVGAKGRDVLIQFMIESIFISFLGGVLGIGFGVTASSMVARFGGWPVFITPFSVILSFVFSTAVGLFFGWYPAQKAASLNPIEALRYE